MELISNYRDFTYFYISTGNVKDSLFNNGFFLMKHDVSNFELFLSEDLSTNDDSFLFGIINKF